MYIYKYTLELESGAQATARHVSTDDTLAVARPANYLVKPCDSRSPNSTGTTESSKITVRLKDQLSAWVVDRSFTQRSHILCLPLAQNDAARLAACRL